MKPPTAVMRPLLAVFLTLSLLLSLSQRAQAQDCAALEDLRIEDTNLLSAVVVPASRDLPEYCRVLGYVRPAINFEIRLPTAGWNGKFYMAGCGGYCGTLESSNSGFINAVNFGLKRSYAVSTMDGGHWGETLFHGRWAYHNRQAEIDFGYRAVHETARVTKVLIEAFYGQRPERSYFAGCSTGGRQAVMEAWRYPSDFDGIISGGPDLSVSDWIISATWLAQANTGTDGKNLISPTAAKLVSKAVYEACDRQDGLEDGLISDPFVCRFDPAMLLCDEGNTSNCLSADQVEALRKMYQGPRDSAGRQLYAGLPVGSEPFWATWVTGETTELRDDLPRAWATQFLRYMAFREDPGEAYTVGDFDVDRDSDSLDFMAEIYDADNPNLDPFRESGGKLLMWHGWADAAVPPMETVEYYEAVEEHVGSRERTQDFFRVFMIPGMDHCGIHNGPGIAWSGFDVLAALERWVEEGEAPARLKTTKTDSTGSVLWTRPVCPYPQRAVYDGEGDPNEVSSFECALP